MMGLIILAAEVSWSSLVVPLIMFAVNIGYLMWHQSRALQKSDLDALKERLSALEKQVVALDTKVAPFWTSLQSRLADALTRPTHYEMDELLKKLQQLTISAAERVQLRGMLTETLTDPDCTEDFRNMARLLLVAMPLVIQEKAGTLKAHPEPPPAAGGGDSKAAKESAHGA